MEPHKGMQRHTPLKRCCCHKYCNHSPGCDGSSGRVGMFVGFKLSITPRLGRKPNTNFGVDSDFTPSQLGPSGLSDSEVAESGPVVTVGRAPSPRGQSRGSGRSLGSESRLAGGVSGAGLCRHRAVTTRRLNLNAVSLRQAISIIRATAHWHWHGHGSLCQWPGHCRFSRSSVRSRLPQLASHTAHWRLEP